MSGTDLTSTCVDIRIGNRADGTLGTEIRFANGTVLTDERDLGLSDTDHALHDVTHAILAVALGLPRSPVLERVAGIRGPEDLSPDDVDLEEAAAFMVQAYCASLRGEDPAPALRNAIISIDRLSRTPEPEAQEDFTHEVLITGLHERRGAFTAFKALDDGLPVLVSYHFTRGDEIIDRLLESRAPIPVRVTRDQVSERPHDIAEANDLWRAIVDRRPAA